MTITPRGRSSRATTTSLLAFASVVGVSAAAHAQQTADAVSPEGVNTSYTVGSGIHLSDEMVLHPQVEFQGGYQPNVFYEDDSENPVGGGLMRFGAGFSIGTNTQRDESEGSDPTPTMLEINSDLMLFWNQYLSSNTRVSDQSNLGADALFDLKVNPKGGLEFQLHDGYIRAVNPPPTETAQDLARDKNELSLTLIGRPGGGALEIYGTARWILDIFERDTAQLANRNMFDLAVGTRWQLFPKTQVNGEVSFGVILVDDQSVKADRDTSTPLRITVGTSTLITPRFGTVLKVGYGNGFYSGANFNSYLALAELRYAIGPTIRVAGGYSHDFADSLVGNFRADHAIYVRAAAQIASSWNLTGKAEMRFRDYEGIPAMANGVTFCSEPGVCMGGTRSDVIFHADLSLDKQLNQWLVAGLSYNAISDTTDAQTISGTSVDSLGYFWQEVMLKLTAKF